MTQSAEGEKLRVAVIAPGRALTPDIADRVRAIVAESAYRDRLDLRFHAQCFLHQGHFAGDDSARADAFVEVACDSEIDVVWFARGGHGAARLLDLVLPRMRAIAPTKRFIGYSDGGNLLAGLLARGIGRPVHGPMPADILRKGGAGAVRRVLDFLIAPDAPVAGPPRAAFNLTVLAHLCATPWMPDLSGRILMLEDIGEYEYRIDRAMFAVANRVKDMGLAGIAAGRFSDVPDNDIDFGMRPHDIVRAWCTRCAIPYLGPCNIGHDGDNEIVAF